MEERCTGFVQYYNRDRGYGFLVPEGGTDPVYFEREDIEHTCTGLSQDQQVTLTLALGTGRYEAKNSRP
ncbi:cold-shock protein [Streptomyces candidus]|uniref:Cold shock CspA family protein n=1 Tax=Streptomyces candidus TaxID=67283 RepID=A0A7X0HP50_9ACTN|nr:cold shock domain-containing protein [Streptomyces candidus]MBB6440029.1 cold shock CspA family protein [Streptomyces candidus]